MSSFLPEASSYIQTAGFAYSWGKPQYSSVCLGKKYVGLFVKIERKTKNIF